MGEEGGLWHFSRSVLFKFPVILVPLPFVERFI